MAAGLGKRMRSKLAKVLHPVAGRPMLLYMVGLADRLADGGTTVVVGHQAAQVRALIDKYVATRSGAPAQHSPVDRIKGLTAHVGSPAGLAPPLVAEQTEQLGTGHAVMQAREAILRARGGPADTYLILNGDTPLLTDATITSLMETHRRRRAAVTILTVKLSDPRGYGRIVRGSDDSVLRIVEDRDADRTEAAIREINVGTYVIDGPFLFEALDKLQPDNAQREYYLTDVVKMAVDRGLVVAAHVTDRPEECLGINSRQQLADAERIMRRRTSERWMEAGVTLRDPASTVIDADVQIGADTVIHPFVTLEGRTTVGSDCVIRSHVRITDSTLGHRVVVQDSCVLTDATLEDETSIGPFAHLRPGALLRRSAKIGNFVEVKKAELGEGSKANHLTYLGDTRVGRDVNIGAGTITCNYDGKHKFETVIEDGVFIGSDTQLVAPVRVGRGAIVAAGSTITQDVPPDALAMSRQAQLNKPGWASRRRALPSASSSSGHEGSGPAPVVESAARPEAVIPEPPRGKGRQTPKRKGK